MQKYVSDYWNQGVKGHSNYNFVDVAVNNDNLLFIDPILIETAQDEWCVRANTVINSFFDSFYGVYKAHDESKKALLLSHAKEQNGTHLGYGRGDNGKGNSLRGLLETFMPLDQLLNEIKTIGKASDLPVLLPGFAADKLSDLLTNILHEHINEFTLSQMEKFGVKSNADLSYWTWDDHESVWKLERSPSFFINGHELLVVPKNIVRRGYLFSTAQYFNRIILERVRMEGEYMDDSGKPLSKKDIVKLKRYSGDHWQYEETIDYTKKNNNALDEYHQYLPSFYAEWGNSMKDEDLDNFIYS